MFNFVRVQERRPNFKSGSTTGGIIIPDTAREKPMQAKVIAVGKEIELSNRVANIGAQMITVNSAADTYPTKRDRREGL